jgi:hypothetical protein
MKYPYPLLNNETKTQKQYATITNFINEKNIDVNTLKRSAFSIGGYGIEPIFDSLAYTFIRSYNVILGLTLMERNILLLVEKIIQVKPIIMIIMKMDTFHRSAYGGYPEVIKQEKSKSKLSCDQWTW